MTSLALTPTSQPQASTLTMPSVTEGASVAALATVDTAGRTVAVVESALDTTAQTINTVVPATVRTVCSFLPLPGSATSAISTVAEAATTASTWLVNTSLQAGAQAFTFGAPAWSQALRQGIAVSGTTAELQHGDTSQEFLARRVAESSEDPLIKQSLLKYLELRKQLKEVQSSGDAAPNSAVTDLARSIASYEVKLRDYQDFRDLKQVLDQKSRFAEEHHKQINTLAAETANRMIDKVENYYKENVGTLAGGVEGNWAKLQTEEQRTAARTALRDKIALKLQKVFNSEMNSAETTSELNAVSHELHVAFDSYRHALAATISTALGVTYATGGMRVALESAWAGTKHLFDATCSWVGDTVSSGLSTMTGWVSTQIRQAVEGVSSWISQTVSDAIASNPLVQGASKAAETITALPAKIDDLAEGLRDTVFGASSPDYNHPYWTGSSRVMVGVDEHFKPIYGHSCTSGFPDTPRIETLTKDFSGLRDFFNTPKATQPTGELLDAIIGAQKK